MAYQRKLGKDIRCPLEYGMELLGGKWNFRIICELTILGTLRYSGLRKKMANITDAALASALKDLIENGIVVRNAYPEIPSARGVFSIGKRLVCSFNPAEFCKWAGVFYKEGSGAPMVQYQRSDYG